MKEERKTYCISHGKDVDGIASASIVKLAYGGKTFLVNYDKIIETLEKIPDNSNVYVCDLGMNDSISERFIEECNRITKKGKFTYIDHHILKPSTKRKILKAKVKLIHSKKECAGVLTYELLKKKVPKEAAILACYAAITDYMDHQQIAKSLISNYDRQLVLLESTMLAYALAYDGAKPQFGNKIVDAFQELSFPHEIKDVPELANKQAERMKSIMKTVNKEAKSYKNFACMESSNPTIGLVANMIIGGLNVPVAFAYRHNTTNGHYEMSFRARYDSKAELGKIVSKITPELGGMGGGHNKACGARIPDNKLNKFIKLFSAELNK